MIYSLENLKASFPITLRLQKNSFSNRFLSSISNRKIRIDRFGNAVSCGGGIGEEAVAADNDGGAKIGRMGETAGRARRCAAAAPAQWCTS